MCRWHRFASYIGPIVQASRLRFGPGVHDGACSTCCLVRRGVSSLEAFLAMLQLLLDSGEVLGHESRALKVTEELQDSHRNTSHSLPVTKSQELCT